jgi:hypothetical protein
LENYLLSHGDFRLCYVWRMRDFIVLLIHLLVTLLRLLGPGGVRAVAAESLLLKHQLIIVGRSRRRAPNLTAFDRLMLGLARFYERAAT